MCRNVDIIYCTHLYTSVHINGGTNFETKLPRLRAQLGAQGLRRPATWNARTRLVQSPVSCSAQATLCHILYVYIADLYYIYIYIYLIDIQFAIMYIYMYIYIHIHTCLNIYRVHIQSTICYYVAQVGAGQLSSLAPQLTQIFVRTIPKDEADFSS